MGPKGRRLDLLTIRLFVAVVEERSLARAAWRENITVSAVSKRISDLEAVLGTELLRRQRSGVEPTLAGQALVAHGRAVLGRVDRLCVEMAGFGEGLRGLIRIAANESAAIGYLPGPITAFLDDCPEVQVDLQIAISAEVVRRVQENAADIGVFTGPEPTVDLQVLPYRRDRLVAVLPAAHPLVAVPAPLSFAAILAHPLIGSEETGAIEALTRRAAVEAGRGLRTRVRVTSFDAAARLVEAGVGITIMPETVAQMLARALRLELRRLAEPWAVRDLNLCLRPGTRSMPAHRRFLEKLALPGEPDDRGG